MSVSRDLFTARVNSTMMSINERFTYLQKKARPIQTSVLTIRAKNAAQQQASAKNRRLAMQMEKRLSAMAALKIKKKIIRQRLGAPNLSTGNVKDRLSFPNRGRGFKRGRGGRKVGGRSLRRSQSVQSLQGGSLKRSASVQSLNQPSKRRGRSRSRSHIRIRAQSRNRSNSVKRQEGDLTPTVAPRMRGSFGTPLIGIGRGGKRAPLGTMNQRLNNQGNMFERNGRNGGNRRGGRGNARNGGNPRGGRGNGRRGGGRRGQMQGARGRSRAMRGKAVGGQPKRIIPTKEELDKQLEQYMANTKSRLDKEIDIYMKESGVNDW